MKNRAEDMLADEIIITTPKVFFEVKESLKDFISKGLLLEVGGTCSLNDIIEGKPFPDDLINIEFETIPGKTRYLLSCETYRGYGGVFKRLS